MNGIRTVGTSGLLTTTTTIGTCTIVRPRVLLGCSGCHSYLSSSETAAHDPTLSNDNDDDDDDDDDDDNDTLESLPRNNDNDEDDEEEGMDEHDDDRINGRRRRRCCYHQDSAAASVVTNTRSSSYVSNNQQCPPPPSNRQQQQQQETLQQQHEEEQLLSVLITYCINDNPIRVLHEYYNNKHKRKEERTTTNNNNNNDNHKYGYKFKNCFQHEPYRLVMEMKDATTTTSSSNYWTSRFTCPIDGRIYYSTLPPSLLLLLETRVNNNNDNDNDNDDNDQQHTNKTILVTMIQQIFGNYYVLPNSTYNYTNNNTTTSSRVVAFASKKAADRSVALIVLLNVMTKSTTTTTSNDTTALVLPTTAMTPRTTTSLLHPLDDNDVIDSTIAPFPTSTTTTTTTTTMMTSTKRRGGKYPTTFPKWVDALHRYGITATDLEISYYQEEEQRRQQRRRHFVDCCTGGSWQICQDGTASSSLSSLLLLSSTLLYCTLNIRTTMTIMGDAKLSKLEAIEDAVTKLTNRLTSSQVTTPIICPTSPGGTNGRTLAKIVAAKKTTNGGGHNVHVNCPNETKKLLLLCDSNAITNYIVSIPPWANAPIPCIGDRQQDNDWEDGIVLYVYELEFVLEKSGKSFVEERGGPSRHGTTPLGIALTKDISRPWHHDGGFETRQFFVKQKNGHGQERVIVRLRNRSIVNLQDLDRTEASVEERIAWMIEFNRTLCWWSTYGFTKAQQNFQSGHNGSKHRSGSEPHSILSSTEQDSSPNDRTYFIVPLTDNGVDWRLLRRVALHECCPYMQTTSGNLRGVRHLGISSERFFIMAFLLLSVAVAAFWMFRLANEASVATTWSQWELKRWEICDGTILLLLAPIAVIAVTTRIRLPPDAPLLSPGSLENHFIVQRGASAAIYVADNNDDDTNAPHPTALSSFPDNRGNDTYSSYASYYENRYGITLRYQREPLIVAKLVKSHADFDFLEIEDTDHPISYLQPELVYILPMPRDVIYLARQVAGFMPLVEREIQLAFMSEELHALSGQNLQCSRSLSSLVPLLREATTLAPESTYQRLEFLGDSVLGFFVAVTIMAKSILLEMTFDDIGESLSQSTTNHALYFAGLRIGVNHLLFTRQSQCKWRSRFAGKRGLKKSALNCYETIPDSIISDVVESLLGATYVHDVMCERTLSGSDRDLLSVSLFEKMRLPMSASGETPDSPSKRALRPTDIVGPCLRYGYPFSVDDAWQQEVAAFRHVISTDQPTFSLLQEKRKALVDILVRFSDSVELRERLERPACSTLLFAAIFHEDGEGHVDYAEVNESAINSDDMLRLSRLRDMLFFVGVYALQLCITTELFQRYPEANEGVLHTLRARAIADDIVVYIMFKAGIHKTIYGMDPSIISKFEEFVYSADLIGMEIWNENGGWLLPGGTAEFARRCNLARRCQRTPQYPGYAGGRLHGQRSKLKLKYTEEPLFAMKAIIGALVLTNGLNDMWSKFVGPLFEEVMLLSIEESLGLFKESTIK